VSADHANCSPGCRLHPELHHAGWVRKTGRRVLYHLYSPGMNISECGAAECEDYDVRQHDSHVKGDHKCARCLRSWSATMVKIRTQEGR
jgi:hypothetical protein